MTPKEPYFTTETIGPLALEMEREYARGGGGPRFRPGRSALLVLDMQAYFLDPASHAYVPSAAAVLPGVQGLVQAYGRLNLPLVFTRHANTPQDAGAMARWWRDLIAADHPLGRIIPDLDTSPGIVLDKSQYDAFYHTGLEALLREAGVEQVLVCGVMAHLCCETSARSAFVRGFDVFFLVDGVATYNLAHHRATLLNLAHGFATLARVEDILSSLEEYGGK